MGSSPSDHPSDHPLIPLDALTRRDFLRLAAAQAALAGLGSLPGCAREPPEQILPYVAQPPSVTPGEPRYYATSVLERGYATGLLVQSREGRPLKVEGNPAHPASLGATTAQQQALVLQVYDPDRAAAPRRGRAPASWESLLALLRAERDDGGAGLRVVAPPSSSPLLHALLARVRARHPAMRTCVWSALDGRAPLEGAQRALGRPAQPLFDLARADVLVALDCDLLASGPFQLPYARRWAERRQLAALGDTPSRLYALECLPSPTGSCADHRLARRSSELGRILAALAAALPTLPLAVRRVLPRVSLDAEAARFVRAMARDLAARPAGRTLLAVGERQPPAVHALGWAVNTALGNVGSTVRAIAPVVPAVEGAIELPELVGELEAGRIDTLLLLETNLVYGAPADLPVAAALERVRDSIYLGLYEDETGRRARWMAPAAHVLESWGDGRAYDGTRSLTQPLVRPLTGGRTMTALLAALAGEHHWDDRAQLAAAEPAPGQWAATLERGFVPDSAAPPLPVTLDPAGAARALERAPALAPPREALELDFHPSPTVGDGRLANNAWLLELPEPITKLTWDNAALLSPRDAERLGIEDEQLVDLALDGRTLRLPALRVPGHADGAVSLWLGFGRAGAESLARRAGFDAGRLRTRAAEWFAAGATLARAAGRHPLARTQLDFAQHGREHEVALALPLAELRKHPTLTDELKGPLPSLLPPKQPTGLEWAMAIDLQRCTGCSACMVACQAENNVLVVGKPEVLRHRQMHWLRIDSYRRSPAGGGDDGRAVHQPMLCQHCDYAPCEYVCPVNATVHSPDGLNEMVYNRCVGTRFCSNNCPYKVRRFNWFDWVDREPANRGRVKWQRNPEVTVRQRGVMEKCTWCVQRLRSAEIRAEIDRRPLGPGEVQTACQQACPTGAIQFGPLGDADSELARWRARPQSYQALHAEGAQPRIAYLARIDDPNPELGR